MEIVTVRLLAARSEYGYTDRIDRALPDEPEAVDAEYQRAISRQASLDAAARARADWRLRRARLAAELVELAVQPYARAAGDELRSLDRQLGRLDRRISSALASSEP